MIGTTTRRAALVAAAGTLLSGALALAQPQLMYPCPADVMGRNFALAEVRWACTDVQDIDAQPFAATWLPQAPQQFLFNDERRASASVAASCAAQGCKTRAEVLGEGKTRYAFDGAVTTMSYKVGSEHLHESDIRRTVVGPVIPADDPVSTTSIYENPGLHHLRVNVPFIVAVDDGWMEVSDSALSRTDTGPTRGQTWITWEVFEDPNCDCPSYPTGTPIARDRLQVGPNDSDSAPVFRFPIPRGCYVLVLTYDTQSTMALRSENCDQSVRDRSEVTDSAIVRFELQP